MGELIEEFRPSERGLENARKHLGRNLRERREAAGLSQSEAAEVAGVSRSSYQRFELGSLVVPFKPLCALAARYGCKGSELLPNEQYLSAPSDAEERLTWVRERNERIRSGRVVFSRSGTEGAGVAPQG